VEETRRAYARLLWAADPRWVRAVRAGVAWVALAGLVPVVHGVFGRRTYELGGWLTSDRQRLAWALMPAVFAVMGCWRLATREPWRAETGLRPDSLKPRLALRVTAIAWMLPFVLMYGPTFRTFYYSDEFVWLLIPMHLCVIPATFLFYRRLGRVVARLPSRALRWQVRVLTLLVTVDVTWFLLVPSLHGPTDLIGVLTGSPVVVVDRPWDVQYGLFFYRPNGWRSLLDPHRVGITLLMAGATTWGLVAMTWTYVTLWRIGLQRSGRGSDAAACARLMDAGGPDVR
jgi:hypothetical protein